MGWIVLNLPVMFPLDQVEDPVGEHLGPDAEVLLVGQRLEGRVRDLTDPHLEGRAVLDQGRDVPPDLHRRLVQRLGRVLEQVDVRLDQDVDLAEGDVARPLDRRHPGLTWAITRSAVSMAARMMSTETPRLT